MIRLRGVTGQSCERREGKQRKRTRTQFFPSLLLSVDAPPADDRIERAGNEERSSRRCLVDVKSNDSERFRLKNRSSRKGGVRRIPVHGFAQSTGGTQASQGGKGQRTKS